MSGIHVAQAPVNLYSSPEYGGHIIKAVSEIELKTGRKNKNDNLRHGKDHGWSKENSGGHGANYRNARRNRPENKHRKDYTTAERIKAEVAGVGLAFMVQSTQR